MKFFVYTLGCKVNHCDSREIYSNLISYGFEESDYLNSDIIIINSCAVTSESVRKTRQVINKFKKINPKSFLILTGCAVIVEQFKNMPQISLIAAKIEIVDKIIKKCKKTYPSFPHNIVKNIEKKTRIFLKIEDGCENFCSYCIIPFVRGKVQSKQLHQIEFDSKNFYELGFKEIVLVGINLGSYGKDNGSNLTEVINVVRKYFKRIRLSSLEPDTVNKDLIEKLSYYEEICPSFHLSLQSGSDRILKLMKRNYTILNYIELIDDIRNRFKKATFTTDLIVGFPYETEKDFRNSLDVIDIVGFIKVNVFQFSPRPGTEALKFDQIESGIKKNRTDTAINYSKSVSKKVISSFVGENFDVLFETKKDNFFYGYSENYIKIKHKSNENLCGQIKNVIFLPEIS
ncbi:MAG: MiaB/RimO family radical SAM methylthiotransferase [Firmicutes bacterium]|nr:MiaB/RimO family radical SAM methylthiotransferase [Bacillota bacterium]